MNHAEKSDLPDDHRISETWEVCDRPGESSEITNGWMRGSSLRQAIDAHGQALLGRAVSARFGTRFPLLIKLLDASNVLGEHVHPGDELVEKRKLDDFSGKTEAWYMLRAKPQASILCGHRPGITPEEFRQALVEDRSRDCMKEYSAGVDDSFLLHAGTIHYSAGGLLFYEIMQNSDINIGLHPPRQATAPDEIEAWTRRTLEAVHFEDGFDCRTRPVTILCGNNRRTWVIVCAHFALERLDLSEPFALEMDGERFRFATVIDGAVKVSCAGGAERLAAGLSCLLPADLGTVTFEPEAEAALLIACVPDLEGDVVEPLRAHGVPDQKIRGLGGESELNPLNALTGG